MGGRYQAYPEYKDSGVEWIGRVPKQWEVKSLRRVLVERNEKNTPVKTDNILSLTIEKGVIPYSERGSGGNKHKEDLTAYKLAYPGDIVLNSMNVVVGAVGLSEYFGAVSPVYYMLRPTQETDNAGYFNDIFQVDTFQKSLVGLGNGIMVKESESSGKMNTIRMRIPMDKLNTVPLPYPTSQEQQQIANFLDHETANIDTLIEKQQQLIALLKEKRQAVISHAVTKGLNPDAPMKDSGVDWLGEVPAHWKVCLIKYICTEITDGAHVSPETEGGQRYFVSIRDIKNGVIDFDNSLLTSKASFDYLVKTGCQPYPGDILFSKDGTIGETAVTPELCEFVVASSLIIIRPDRKQILPKYLNFLVQSEIVKEQVESFVKGAALRRLSIQNLLKIGGTFPPIEEQKEIVDYLNKELKQYDLIETRASILVDLLKERRTALISAAVTGKIDVRNWQSPTDKDIQ